MAEKQSCYHSFELEESRDYIDILYKTLSELPPMVPVMKCSDTQLTAEKENFKKLELELAEVKTAKAATCETVARYKEQLDTLTREADEMDMHSKANQDNKMALEQRFLLLSKSKISNQQQQQLESLKFRYKALRNMTGVKFIKGDPDNNNLEGYTFNVVNNKTKAFSISKDPKLSSDQISDSIMKCVGHTAGIYSDLLLE